MDEIEIAKILRYTRPSKTAKPKGFSYRLEKWESMVLEFCQEFMNRNPDFISEPFLEACGFYRDIE